MDSEADIMIVNLECLTVTNEMKISTTSIFQDEFDALAQYINKLSEGKPAVFVINRGNWGDSVIREGCQRFLRHYSIPHAEVRFDDLVHKRTSLKEVKAQTGHSDPVMIFSGNGLMIPKYSRGVRYAAKLTNEFSRSIILPSTNAIDLSEFGFQENCSFIVRDRFESRERLPDSYFCHDMAFFMSLAQSGSGEGEGWLMREDVERPQSTPVHKNNIDISKRGNECTPLDSFFDYINRFETIHTNRLHVAITGALLGKQVTLSGNSYFKNRAIFKTSLEPNFPNVKFVENLLIPRSQTRRWYNSRVKLHLG